MTALIAPDDEEAYLLAILEDPDGLDLAEFAWTDPESEDGCYRAWDFQWPWYTCEDTYQVDQGARATGKTVSITMRAFAMPFARAGQRMLITAPELNHLRPLTDAIEQRVLASRLATELLPAGKSHGMNRQPHWQCKFTNGTQIVSRLPGRDGKGVKGQHVMLIELDEAQDYPLAGWIEVVETLNRFAPGAMWRCHGVPKGVRDRFYEITEGGAEDEASWTVHRPLAPMRPSWDADERQEKIRSYGGSRQNIDYRRNIYGEHGDASNSVFVLSRLMGCTDTDQGSVYNTDVYTTIRIEYERVAAGMSIETFLDQIPGSHRRGYSQTVGGREVGSPKGYSAFWAGMDVGVTNHPSEILLFGQRSGTDLLELLLRVHMQRINTDDQKQVIERLFDFYGAKLQAFALDKTGVGFPIWDQLTRAPFGKRIYGYNFSEKVIVGFTDRPLEQGEKREDLAIQRNVVEATTDLLRNDYVDLRKLRLPFDRELLLEFQGQTYMVVKDSGNPYGTKRVFAGGSFHTLDAAKMAMAGRHLPGYLDLLEQPQAPVLDAFLGGWL